MSVQKEKKSETQVVRVKSNLILNKDWFHYNLFDMVFNYG